MSRPLSQLIFLTIDWIATLLQSSSRSSHTDIGRAISTTPQSSCMQYAFCTFLNKLSCCSCQRRKTPKSMSKWTNRKLNTSIYFSHIRLSILMLRKTMFQNVIRTDFEHKFSRLRLRTRYLSAIRSVEKLETGTCLCLCTEESDSDSISLARRARFFKIHWRHIKNAIKYSNVQQIKIVLLSFWLTSNNICIWYHFGWICAERRRSQLTSTFGRTAYKSRPSKVRKSAMCNGDGIRTSRNQTRGRLHMVL